MKIIPEVIEFSTEQQSPCGMDLDATSLRSSVLAILANPHPDTMKLSACITS